MRISPVGCELANHRRNPTQDFGRVATRADDSHVSGVTILHRKYINLLPPVSIIVGLLAANNWQNMPIPVRLVD